MKSPPFGPYCTPCSVPYRDSSPPFLIPAAPVATLLSLIPQTLRGCCVPRSCALLGWIVCSKTEFGTPGCSSCCSGLPAVPLSPDPSPAGQTSSSGSIPAQEFSCVGEGHQHLMTLFPYEPVGFHFTQKVIKQHRLQIRQFQKEVFILTQMSTLNLQAVVICV